MKTDYCSVLKKFKRLKVLVIGDFILDVYLKGNCTRIAPEASVPVIDLTAKVHCLGGAANAAANLTAMGCKVLFCSVTGEDRPGEIARQLLLEAGVSPSLLIAAKARTTMVKTRVTAPSHTLLRYDEGSTNALSKETEVILIENLKKVFMECDAVLIADYDKGVLTPAVMDAICELKQTGDKFIAVDSKRIAAFAALKPALIKPNYEEAIQLLSLPHTDEARAAQLIPHGKALEQHTNAAVIALTLDQDGAVFFEKGVFKHHMPAVHIHHPFVSGAGDTFISACLLALVTNCSLSAAAAIASAAAAVAVSKPDTAICNSDELENALIGPEQVIYRKSNLREKCRRYKLDGKRIVFTNGCFDILHSGHVNYLRKAKELGDILIVGLNTDASVKRLKGSDRPVNSLQNRIEVLAGLACIDHIVTFGSIRDDTPIGLLRTIKPDVFVKGGDYQGKYLPEEVHLKKMACRIEFLPFVFNQSTTKIILRIQEKSELKIAIAN